MIVGIIGLIGGYARLQLKVDDTAQKVDVLYQRALWQDSGRTGPPATPLKEE